MIFCHVPDYMWTPVTSLSMLMYLSLCVCVCVRVCLCGCVSLFSAAHGAFACLKEGSLEFFMRFFMFGGKCGVIKTGHC